MVSERSARTISRWLMPLRPILKPFLKYWILYKYIRCIFKNVTWCANVFIYKSHCSQECCYMMPMTFHHKKPQMCNEKVRTSKMELGMSFCSELWRQDVRRKEPVLCNHNLRHALFRATGHHTTELTAFFDYEKMYFHEHAIPSTFCYQTKEHFHKTNTVVAWWNMTSIETVLRVQTL